MSTTIDFLTEVDEPSAADLEYERGYNDGEAGNPVNGTNPDYLEGWAEGKASSEEDDDYYSGDWDGAEYGYEYDDTDEEW